MRENLSKTSNETLCCNGFQTPYNEYNNNQKQMLFSVSSNVYYGYQPLTAAQNTTESMHTDDLGKPNDEMDTTQLESPLITRKRTRTDTKTSWDNCKKRRQNELPKPNNLVQMCSSSKLVLEEDLLRETHGCSYYHWIASNL